MNKKIPLYIPLLFFLIPAARANNLNSALACSPEEEMQKAIVMCAVSWGGCAAAAKIVEAKNEKDSEVKAFLAGESCSMLANQLIGEGYNASTFLGNVSIELGGKISEQLLTDKDPDNDWQAS